MGARERAARSRRGGRVRGAARGRPEARDRGDQALRARGRPAAARPGTRARGRADGVAVPLPGRDRGPHRLRREARRGVRGRMTTATATLTITNPGTGAIVAEVPAASREDVYGA